MTKNNKKYTPPKILKKWKNDIVNGELYELSVTDDKKVYCSYGRYAHSSGAVNTTWCEFLNGELHQLVVDTMGEDILYEVLEFLRQHLKLKQLDTIDKNNIIAYITKLIKDDKNTNAHITMVNNWLGLYEYLYAKINQCCKTDLVYAQACLLILSHLDRLDNETNDFFVQANILRVYLISQFGTDENILNPIDIFNQTKQRLANIDINTINFNIEIIEKNREEIKFQRNIKKLLVPIANLKKINITDDYFTDWLAIQSQLT